MHGRLTALRSGFTALLSLAVAQPTLAIESLSLKSGRIDGATWSIEAVDGHLVLRDDDRLGVMLDLTGLTLPRPAGDIGKAKLACDALTTDAGAYRCEAARVTVIDSPLGQVSLAGDIRYQPETRRISIASAHLQTSAGVVALTADWQPLSWSAQATLTDVSIANLAETLKSFQRQPSDIEVFSGTLSGQLHFSALAEGWPHVDAELRVGELDFANEEDTSAVEGVGARLSVRGRSESGSTSYRFEAKFHETLGEAYFEPVYLDLSERPVAVELAGDYRKDSGHLVVSSFTFEQPGALSLRATAELPAGGRIAALSADVDIVEATLPGIYDDYAKGFLVGTPLAALQTSGNVTGQARIRQGNIEQLDLSLHKLNADDTAGVVAIYGATGNLHWLSSEAARIRGPVVPSALAWEGGFVYAIGFGAGAVTLAVSGGDVSMRGPLRIPVLDGALVVTTFAARALQSDAPELDFDAVLEPVELRRLTTAFGWPAFPGTLSGKLPMLSLRDGVITIGGSLVANAFDGTVRVSDLRVEDPFRAARRGSASIVIDNLDLRLLTEVFSFGHMEGRIDGRVDALRTFRGKPVAFDAHFVTPADDRSRHRISRRALNNISDIAGGGSALVSTGLLRFFEDFGYASMGIGCRLENDVCTMSGVEAATGGYYLVKGRSLPRIDVIGHAREVNWPQLIAQIDKALKSREGSQGETGEEPK